MNIFLHGETRNTALQHIQGILRGVGPEVGLAAQVWVEPWVGQAGGWGLSGFRDGQTEGRGAPLELCGHSQAPVCSRNGKVPRVLMKANQL